MLPDDVIEEYLKPLTPDQSESIQSMRALIHDVVPNLSEAIDTGKWWGGLLAYSTADGTGLYALGPRTDGYTTFHMAPYYMSTALQERHGDALKKLLTGKSCIKFKQYADVPEDALRDILDKGTADMLAYIESKKKR